MVDPAPLIPTEEPEHQFDPDEQLYFRVRPDEHVLDAVTLEDIPSLPLSVNRGSLSQPEDVIANYPGWGIIGFPVKAIPKTLAAEQGDTEYQFRIVTKVEHGNEAHADIECLKNGKRVEKSSKISETVKLKFRESIRRHARWIRRPDNPSQ